MFLTSLPERTLNSAIYMLGKAFLGKFTSWAFHGDNSRLDVDLDCSDISFRLPIAKFHINVIDAGK